MTLSPELTERIEKTINQNRIMLFMKGSPAMPQCGFSATVVQLLKQTGAQFGAYNILADAELREGLKQYASWPTYPQLYVDGKLVGGCDIIRELHARGELAPTLGITS
ncbi:MAG TPA: Grx4 family monothiol glutaredoxin [Polyangia bacterium]